MKIGVIGHPEISNTELAKSLINKCDMPVVVDSEPTKPLIIKALPKLEQPKIDIEVDKFNHIKHEETCFKNRKFRKRRKKLR